MPCACLARLFRILCPHIRCTPTAGHPDASSLWRELSNAVGSGVTVDDDTNESELSGLHRYYEVCRYYTCLYFAAPLLLATRMPALCGGSYPMLWAVESQWMMIRTSQSCLDYTDTTRSADTTHVYTCMYMFLNER